MQQTAHADERGPAVSHRHFDIISVFVFVCGCVCLCINTRVDKWTVALSIAVPLYNRDYSSNRNNSFNLVHLSRCLSLMSDCTKKGQGGLGLGGWNKQLGFALSPFPYFSLSVRLQGLLWHTVIVSLLAIKANPNYSLKELCVCLLHVSVQQKKKVTVFFFCV